MAIRKRAREVLNPWIVDLPKKLPPDYVGRRGVHVSDSLPRQRDPVDAHALAKAAAGNWLTLGATMMRAQLHRADLAKEKRSAHPAGAETSAVSGPMARPGANRGMMPAAISRDPQDTRLTTDLERHLVVCNPNWSGCGDGQERNRSRSQLQIRRRGQYLTSRASTKMNMRPTGVVSSRRRCTRTI